MSGGVWIASYVLLWVAVVVLGLVCLALLRQVGVLHARLSPLGVHFGGEGLPPGTPAPMADRYDWASAPLTLVAFTSPTCSLCAELAPSLRALEAQYEDVRLLTVSLGPATQAVFDAFRVASTPYFVTVDGGGTVRLRGVANTLEQVEVMLTESSASAR